MGRGSMGVDGIDIGGSNSWGVKEVEEGDGGRGGRSRGGEEGVVEGSGDMVESGVVLDSPSVKPIIKGEVCVVECTVHLSLLSVQGRASVRTSRARERALQKRERTCPKPARGSAV